MHTQMYNRERFHRRDTESCYCLSRTNLTTSHSSCARARLLIMRLYLYPHPSFSMESTVQMEGEGGRERGGGFT